MGHEETEIPEAGAGKAMKTIYEQFDTFRARSFTNPKRLDDQQLRILRHFYFGGWDDALQFVMDEVPTTPLMIVAPHVGTIQSYNAELRRLKNLRKPKA